MGIGKKTIDRLNLGYVKHRMSVYVLYIIVRSNFTIRILSGYDRTNTFTYVCFGDSRAVKDYQWD